MPAGDTTPAASPRARDPDAPAAVAVAADPPGEVELLRAAARLAVDLDLPLLEKPSSKEHDMLLVVAPGRVELRVLKGDAGLRGGRAVFADLAQVDATSGAGRSLSQPIARAVGRKRRSDPPPTVIDATAGWGEDAWLLASLGCRVLAVERDRVVHTLLRDGLLRLGSEHPEVLQRVSVVRADARHMLRRIAQLRRADRLTASKADVLEGLPPQMRDFLEPDVVYLDPMFSAGPRKAAERKPMRVLRALVGEDPDAAELLELALRVARQRVVVKRPLRAEPLGGVKPTTTHKGKSLRYDVYVPPRETVKED